MQSTRRLVSLSTGPFYRSSALDAASPPPSRMHGHRSKYVYDLSQVYFPSSSLSFWTEKKKQADTWCPAWPICLSQHCPWGWGWKFRKSYAARNRSFGSNTCQRLVDFFVVIQSPELLQVQLVIFFQSAPLKNPPKFSENRHRLLRGFFPSKPQHTRK